ncbi:hypothetical protein REW02_001780 [Klebsiella aerogenes]|nr:hypothetical protein [Klebsiella aerogenes]
MTDITRLLASLKRRSAHAKEFGDSITFVKLKDIDALVEALEKAQCANAAQDDHINQQQDRIEQLERRNAEIGKYAGSLETSHKKLRESMAAIHNTVRLDGVNTRLSTILSASKRAYDESATAIVQESRTVTIEPFRAFVTDADLAALHRFAECCDDPEAGGHDLEKEQVRRLESIGALQRSGRISYITGFGDFLISITAGIKWGAE